MSATTLSLTVEPGVLDARSSWAEFESLVVEMSREVGLRALEETLADAQERLIDSVCGPRWVPVRGLPAPFACPRCERVEDFARKGTRTRRRKLHTAAGTVELVLWHVGCRDCERVFAPLLVMLGLSGKRRTDRLTVDLAELGTQVSFARAAGLSRQLAPTTATAGQAHNSLADTAALLTGADGTLGPGHPSPDVVGFDGTGARAGTNKNGVGANLAIGLTGRSGPDRRCRAHTHLLGLTVGADWPALAAQLAGLPAPALVVLDGETEITTLSQQLWPATPIQRCWWHLPHGLREAFYADDAANRHVNPHWARHTSDQLGELLRDSIRLEQTTQEALAAFDAFTQAIPDKLTSAHGYLAAARDHTFTYLEPTLRARLAHLGGPELGTGVLERVMRELNARTDIGGSR
ncbi:MAG: ISH6 family transposase [Pseudonocardiaceae bacterium]